MTAMRREVLKGVSGRKAIASAAGCVHAIVAGRVIMYDVFRCIGLQGTGTLALTAHLAALPLAAALGRHHERAAAPAGAGPAGCSLRSGALHLLQRS